MEKSGASFPLLSILFCIFVVLKLTGVIAWSWWWVTAPLWAPVLVLLWILIAGALIAVLTHKSK